MKRTAILFLLLLTGVGSAAGADRKAVVPLSVLYVGNSKSPRAGDYEPEEVLSPGARGEPRGV